MIHCKELNRSFSTKGEMFAALIAGKDQVISLKKAALKNSDAVSFGLVREATTVKAAPKSLEYGDYIYPVINTTNYLDSHNDLHVDGIWNKSAKDQNGKIYYIINHKLEIGSVISYPKEVEIMVKRMKWADLGKDYPGETEALIFKSQLTEKSNRDAFAMFKSGEDVQQSIRMEYVDIELAIDDDGKEFKREKALFDKYMKVMVNPEVGTERGYFWVVSEAKIHKEGSAVLFGSNDATSTLYDLKDTTNQPPQSTGKEPSFSIKTILQTI